MPTLYVENVPPAIYKALRERARKNRKSIAAACGLTAYWEAWERKVLC